MMPSKNYWINRSNQRMDRYILRSEQTANEIAKAYYAASKRIEKEMAKTVQGLAKLSDTRTAVNALRKSSDASLMTRLRNAVQTMPEGKEKQEALTLLSSPAYQFRLRRLQATIDNAGRECDKLYRTELKDVTEHLRTLYDDAFLHTMYDVDRGYNTLHTFSLFPASRVDQLLMSKWSGENYSQRIWNSTRDLAEVIKEQLLISYMTGSGVSETARAIQEHFKSSAYAARRLVRTETNYIANQSEMDAYKRLGIEHYQFIATLDTRTSKLCQRLDGYIFPTEEAKSGVNLPPMHPNCRSTTIMYNAESPIRQRIARDENGKNIYVPGDMKYSEWLEKYHPEMVDKKSKRDIIKSIDIDDFELRAYGSKIEKEVLNSLWKEINDCQTKAKVYFSDVVFKEQRDMNSLKSALETQMVGFNQIQLNVNRDLFSGKTIEEVNEMFAKADHILANTLEEAVVHERGHVKTIKGLTVLETENVFETLKNIHIDGISQYAYSDGAECIAEVEILLERGEAVSEKAMELYNKYVLRR